MSTLIDTNILLRTVNSEDPQYETAVSALALLRLRNEPLYIAPQNLIEFRAVATRPSGKNGLGLTPSEAEIEISAIRRFFRLLPNTMEVLETWQRMVVELSVSGKQSHDAHLAAFMQVHGVATILTFNSSDFHRFQGIEVFDPNQA